jgi:hypothetical protein
MQVPAPEIIILNADEYRRAVRRVAELRNARKGSIDEAERSGLMAAVAVWEQDHRGEPKPATAPHCADPKGSARRR